MASCAGGNSGSPMPSKLFVCGLSASYYCAGNNGSEDSEEEEESRKAEKRGESNWEREGGEKKRGRGIKRTG